MLYLSQAIGRPVLDANGEPIGKVDDLIVAVGDRYPPVTGLVVATDRRRIFLPWSPVARFDASGARLSTDRDRHHQVPGSRRRDPAPRRSARQADRRHRRAQGRPRQRPPPRRRRRPPAPGRRRRRRRGPHPPPRDRGRLPDPGPQPATADARALHRLGGCRPGRDEHRLDQAARPARRTDRAPSGGPRDHHRPARPARPGRDPRRPRRRGRRRRDRGDGARPPRSRSSRTSPPSGPPTSSRR